MLRIGVERPARPARRRPAVGRTRAATLLDRSYGPKIHSCNADGGDRRSWDAGAHRLHAPASAATILSLRDGFTASTSARVRRRASPKRSRESPAAHERRRRPSGALRRRLDGLRGKRACGQLFRLDRTFRCIRSTPASSARTPMLSPDGRTFYFADTGGKLIWAYDFDTLPATFARAASSPPSRTRGHATARRSIPGFVWSCEVYSAA